MSDLTAKEQDNVRAALRFLRARCGGWRQVADAIKANVYTVRHTVQGRGASASMAVRVARFAGVGVDEVLTGKFPPAGVCAHCGQAVTS